MSSFKGVVKDIDDIDRNESDVITREDREEVVKVGKLKFRRFKNLSQEHIYHYIWDLENNKKIYFDKSWWYEIKSHICHFSCEDSAGLNCPDPRGGLCPRCQAAQQ